jgi:hypothetical protein
MSTQMEEDLATRAMQAYARNRPKQLPDKLRQYVGHYVAWNPEATDVLASAATRKELRERVVALGYEPQQCVVERIAEGRPWPGTV